MSGLLRELAPITAEGWKEIEAEAKQTLTSMLAGRKLVDFKGPLGWHSAAIGTGRTRELDKSSKGGMEIRLREVQPLVELRTPFELSRTELDALDRGAKDADLNPVVEAARTAAMAEDRAIFHGQAKAQITGIFEAGSKTSVTITDDYERYPSSVAEAAGKLRSAGVQGPYALILGPRCYTGVSETTTKGGFPVLNHIQRMIDGPIIWAPAVDGAVLASQRGGDFELTVGRDFSIGYLEHSTTVVKLYIEESFTFRVLVPEAAVPMTYRKAKLR
jgi:uncharacterized linocin/CFP29 family protein